MESWGLHAVIYPKNKFTLEEAKANFAEHHKPKFMRETKSSYRYRVIPKTRFSQYRSKKLPNDSTLIYGELLPKWKHLSGSGFFSNIKNVAKNVITKIASVPGKIAEQFTRRHNYNNTSARTLDKHKDEVITKMVIIRTPIMAILDKVFNILTFGSWAKAKEQVGYDKMFHLQLRINDILVEKNEVINITENLSSITDKSEQLVVSSFPNSTIGEFMKKGEDSMGSNYWLYDAFSNNCQNFIMGLLSANGCLTEEAKAFIYQPVEELVKRIPKYMGIIAKGATGIGAVANRLMGKGEVEDRKKAIKEQYLKEVAIGEKQNMKGIAWRKRLREDGALKAKVYEDAKTMPIDDAYRDRVMGISDNVVNGGSRNSGYIFALLKGKIKNEKFDLIKMKNPSEWFKKKYTKYDGTITSLIELINQYNDYTNKIEEFDKNIDTKRDAKQKEIMNTKKPKWEVERLLKIWDAEMEFDKNIDAKRDAKQKEIMNTKKPKWEVERLLKQWNAGMKYEKEQLYNARSEIYSKYDFLRSLILKKRSLKASGTYVPTPEQIANFAKREDERIAYFRKGKSMNNPYLVIPKLKKLVGEYRRIGEGKKPLTEAEQRFRNRNKKRELTDEEETLKRQIIAIKSPKTTIGDLRNKIKDTYPNVPTYSEPFKNKNIALAYENLYNKHYEEMEEADDDEISDLKKYFEQQEFNFKIDNATKPKLVSYILTFPEFQPKKLVENERTEADQIEYNIRKAIKRDLVDFILSMPELAKLYIPVPKQKKELTSAQKLRAYNYMTKIDILKALRESYTTEQIRKAKIRVSKGIKDLRDDLTLAIDGGRIDNIFL